VTRSSIPGDELVSAIRRRIVLLEARRDALTDLSVASGELRSRLRDAPVEDIGSILNARERDCHRLASLGPNTPQEWDDAETTRQITEGMNGEAGALARTVVALQSDSEVLAEEILDCQRECEALLKQRLRVAAGALRESRQRRKLDAAYGPACRHASPSFLDKQQ
jgi:hypothetical protein